MIVTLFQAFAEFTPAGITSQAGVAAFAHPATGEFHLTLLAEQDPVRTMVCMAFSTPGFSWGITIDPLDHRIVKLSVADGGGSPIDPPAMAVSVMEVRGTRPLVTPPAAHP